MTFAGCRYLGLETKWDQTTGLEINKTNISYPLDEYQTSGLNSNQYIASIPEFKIMINGRTVDNNNAEFPLLIFREITYFPLTWEYAVNEFEWDYRFDPIHGLVITSQNSSPKPLNLIDYIHSESGYGNFIIQGDYIYYAGNEGVVYQAPINDSVQLECNGPVSQEKYEVLGSSIYYFSDTDQRVYKSGENTPLNFGELGESLQWLGDFVSITFDTTLDNSYRSIVFDQNGVMAFILPRRMRLASADSNKMVYFDEYERSIFLVELK